MPGSEQTIERDTLDVTITSGQSLSAAANAKGYLVVGVSVPATFDGSALTFQVSPDGTTWYNAYDAAGTELNITASASRFIALPQDAMQGVEWLKVRAGTAAAGTNQTTTDTILTLHVRRAA